MRKTMIWVWPIRLSHWLLVIGFMMAVKTSHSETGMNPHFAFGMFTGSLIFMRLLFGAFGSKYARFRDFLFSIDLVKKFFAGLFDRSKDKDYLGHNPLASWVMLGIMLAILFAATSGMAIKMTKGADWAKAVHEVSVISAIALIALHLLGVISDVILRVKNGTLVSMFTGKKNLAGEDAELTGGQKVFSLAWFINPLLAFYLGSQMPSKKPPVQQGRNQPVVESEIDSTQSNK